MLTSYFIAAAVVVSSPFFSLFADANPCVRTYTIQQGDICDSISAAQQVSTYQLAVINAGIIDATCSNLVPGNTICLGYQDQDCTTTYVVKANDTCDQITSAQGTNSTMLWANNPQIDSVCDNIYIGEVLCVAGSVIVPPPPTTPVPTNIPSTATPAVPSSTTSSSTDDLPWCDEL